MPFLGSRVFPKLLFFPLLVSLAACGDSTEPSSPDPEETTPDLVPLEEGNRWTFLETIERPASRTLDLALPSSGALVREVRGTRTLEGVEYNQVIDTGGEAPDTVYYTLVEGRLSMFDLDFGPLFEVAGSPDLIGEALDRSFPWVIADEADLDRTPRSVAFLDTSITVGGVNFDHDLDVRVRFVGEEAVETPAGAWSDAKRFQLESLRQIEIGFEGVWSSAIQHDLWLVDSLGWVREEAFETLSADGEMDQTRRTRELTRFESGSPTPSISLER